MGRLPGFDYKSPFFYMVTLKRLKGFAAFSEIGPKGLVENELTRAFAAVIRAFPTQWRCCEEISPFAIMPDHLHLLIKIRATPDRVALGVLVNQLAKALRTAYWRVIAADAAMGRTPTPGPTGDAGQFGRGGSAGCAGQFGRGGSAGCAGQFGRGGSAGCAGQFGRGGFAGCAGQFGRGGSAGCAGQFGRGGSAGCAGQIGRRGFAGCVGQFGRGGSAGCVGQFGRGGFAGCAGQFGRGGSAGCASAQPHDIFEHDWHDWFVKKEGQLAAFRRYIRENAARAWERRAHAQYFGRVSEVAFLGRRWFAYGNHALLDLPVLMPFKGHRATAEGSHEWNALLTEAGRIGPGGAGVSTFMSPLEKACGNAIARAGGALIVLSPEGFGPRWHPPREKERFCAQGRMLFLSLYEATTRQPTRAELYHRCHEMIDLSLHGLDH